MGLTRVVNIVYNRSMNAVINDVNGKALDLAGLRHRASLTTRQVGAQMGLSHARIVQIEGEGTKDMDQLEALAAIYGVGFDEMRAANRLTKTGK